MVTQTFSFPSYTAPNPVAIPCIHVLNELISACGDSVQVFRAAAEAIEIEELEIVLEAHAQQREKFASYLATFALDLGGEAHRHRNPDALPSNTKSRVEDTNATAILAQAIHSEDLTLSRYADADVTVLPSVIQAAIDEQHKAIANARQRLQQLLRVYSD